jgi:S-DNA-T family DNA segregation ATPase FtsK/SpoIIIE
MMRNIINKTLRFELIILFILTLISFVAFYFQDSLPDHYLTVSSNNQGSGIVSYIFYSAIAWVGYYVGPWIVAPFIVFTFYYAMLYSRRDFYFDILNFLPLCSTCLFLCLYLLPQAVGEGIIYTFRNNVEGYYLLLIATLGAPLFLIMSYRSSFIDIMKRCFRRLGSISHLFDAILNILNPIPKINYISGVFKRLKERTSVAVPSMLKNGVSNNPSYTNSFESEELFEDVIDEDGELSQDEDFAAVLDDDEEQVDDLVEGSPVKPSRKIAIQKYKKKNKDNNEKEYYSIVKSLSKSQKRSHASHPEANYFEKIISSLEETLSQFKIDGKIVNILKGPVVDTFELELGPGVKVSKVTNSENELSMALLGAPIRIVYPMIGRATVGIEVPRNPREIIYLDEVLSSKKYQNSNLKLPVAMGKNAFGETFVVDLASMPHMLVAGATGAGKSVFINTLLVSLLAKKSPTQMKLILIDPKQLELALYATLPHLVMPVITAPKEASIALLWACQEMERRYSILKEFGVRNIEGFNEKLKNANPHLLAKIHQYYENEPEGQYELPYLVIIVDEFADLILTKAGKEIENNICRLAAKARAAGVHLVLATQRPSVDVITGLIKSNFPTRVSFRVTSSIDSRTILNSTGAEKLLGKGDMLYRHGTDNLRVHSSYVDENEIEALTDKLASMPKNYHEGAMDFLENGGEQEVDPYSFGSHLPTSDSANSEDEYFKDAVRIVIEQRTASASMLQRRMKIGYNRAANLIEEMESRGIVGPAEGSKRRKVLMSSEELS